MMAPSLFGSCGIYYLFAASSILLYRINKYVYLIDNRYVHNRTCSKLVQISISICTIHILLHPACIELGKSSTTCSNASTIFLQKWSTPPLLCPCCRHKIRVWLFYITLHWLTRLNKFHAWHILTCCHKRPNEKKPNQCQNMFHTFLLPITAMWSWSGTWT